MLGVHVVSKGAYTAVCFCIILSASFLLTAPESALAEERGKAVIVFIDRVSLDDIIEAEMPNLDHLISFGGIGLMTTNRRQSFAAGCISYDGCQCQGDWFRKIHIIVECYRKVS